MTTTNEEWIVDLYKLHDYYTELDNFGTTKEEESIMALRIVDIVAVTSRLTAKLIDTMASWDEIIQKNDLLVKFPIPIMDYVDILVHSGKVEKPEHIIALFETGELKNIYDKEGKFDQKVINRIKKLVKKHNESLKEGSDKMPNDEKIMESNTNPDVEPMGKILDIDDDIF